MWKKIVWYHKADNEMKLEKKNISTIGLYIVIVLIYIYIYIKLSLENIITNLKYLIIIISPFTINIGQKQLLKVKKTLI